MTHVQQRLLSRVDRFMMTWLGRSPKGFLILAKFKESLSGMDSLMLKKIPFASEDFSTLITYIRRPLNMNS